MTKMNEILALVTGPFPERPAMSSKAALKTYIIFVLVPLHTQVLKHASKRDPVLLSTLN